MSSNELKSLTDLMENMLRVEVNDRYDAVQALHHDFFKFSNLQLAAM